MQIKALKTLYTRGQIAERVREIGKEISKDYADKEVTAVCVMKGALFFCADLLREVSVKHFTLDFVQASSYSGTESTGTVQFRVPLSSPVKGRHILLVEDVVDTGRTLKALKELLMEEGALSVKIAAMVDKHERREVELTTDYAGFVLDKGFIVGYGLDLDQSYRELPYIAEVICEED